MKEKLLKKTILSGMMLALALVLPFLTGQVPAVGGMLCPMHLPVLLTGFICGPVFGAVTGFVSPLLRFALTGMPPMFPTGASMAFELAAYGLLSGLFFRLFPKRIPFYYLELILAMIGGRAVWGCARTLIAAVGSVEFSFSAFLSGAIVTAIPGIALQIALIPPIVAALKKQILSLETGK